MDRCKLGVSPLASGCANVTGATSCSQTGLPSASPDSDSDHTRADGSFPKFWDESAAVFASYRDGDKRVSGTDFVVAFVDCGYDQGPRKNLAAVPEPARMCLLTLALISVVLASRRQIM